MSLPRLTGTLRAFTSLSVTNQIEETKTVKDELTEKWHHTFSQNNSTSVSWKMITSLTKQSSSDIKSVDFQKEKFRELINVAKNIIGSESDSAIIEEAASFIFITFMDTPTVTNGTQAKLQAYFGPYPLKFAVEACSIVNSLISSLPQEFIDKFEKLTTSDNDQRTQSKETISSFSVKYKPADHMFPLEYKRTFENEEQVINSESVFDMQYQNFVPEKDPPASFNSNKVDGSWLRKLVERSFSSDESHGISINDLCTSIVDALVSPKSDEELQNELFELLGFDRFELIENVLHNRGMFIADTQEDIRDEIKMQAAIIAKQNHPVRPTYGCQVTVQSEQEKNLLKAYRREEKKYIKRKETTDVPTNSLSNFDPLNLKLKREAALFSATNQLMHSSTTSAALTKRVQYPFVFDKQAEARQSSAFIGGSKLALPEGFERDVTETYEEIYIPPSDPPPVTIGKNKISTDQLGEVGKMAFKSTKQLNRIQSVVYEAAYHTNQNLLICAPTGAGKTNIAMLCVLHQIQQFIDPTTGVIKKDNFKIVYVAPMKALAAEMVRNFNSRLQGLGISVRELTGDMQLTKAEILKTQMLVTTPEKWDVVTRKSTGDVALTQIVRLLIIDEIHLLHDDRGAVLECLVARTLRQIETSQSMIRIVGLSATLPNYVDVARFLNVNLNTGLFYFDGRFRPVPLSMTFVGVKSTNRMQSMLDTNSICYDKVFKEVKKGHQVMVFVHARNETVRTAMTLREMAQNKGHTSTFLTDNKLSLGDALKQMDRSRNKPLKELFPDGFGIHHAGMLRQDRNLVEKYFAEGLINVLVCTATLAWGVNLPAHAVIIKGTQLYDAKRGSFVDLGILDVMQIFGRAGRPQFDTFGHGTIITTHDKLSHYLSLMTRANPIESQFISSLEDNLNAEVALGTVTNTTEAVKWLSYTYLYVRMRQNPLVYGLTYADLENDINLEKKREELIVSAANSLDKARMVRFNEHTGFLYTTDLGRTSSHFYIKHNTIEVFNEIIGSTMSEDCILQMLSQAQEFEQIKVRDEELDELDEHLVSSCRLRVAGSSENTHGKVNILLQAYISRQRMNNFSLVSDQAYVAQNSSRIMRGLFEIALRKNWAILSGRLLTLSKSIEKQLWPYEHPLRQFPLLSPEILFKLEGKKLSIDKLREMNASEIGHMITHIHAGDKVKRCVNEIPTLEIVPTVQPITRTVLRVSLQIKATFRWNDRVHGSTNETFWIWIEDPESNYIYHSDYFIITKKQVVSSEQQSLVFTIPISEPLPTQYYVRAVSDRWLGSELTTAVSFKHLILPEKHPPHTALLDLQLLPITVLKEPKFQSLYSFSHFNPIQTQVFFTLYHTDCNVLLGAPTGSGKTVAAELAIFRVFREYPQSKCVYIAPLKALVKERIDDWKVKIEQKLGKNVVELTGDVAPDIAAIGRANLIVTTPEKWDGISRSWATRNYVRDVRLIVIDEIHLLGNDRGPVLEVIVSRTNFISSHTEQAVRVVGLSTALANARDLADWLAIKTVGLFNFKPAVRPVPLETHIQGFAGKHYCPRMATMNKPTYEAIKTHSPTKPVLVFVSSRRQTRLTAQDLIAFLAGGTDSKQWLHMPETEMEQIINGVNDTNLKLTLAFGIGIHHAGLHERDRKTVEELFCNQKIQVLIATSTLAWGVNFPAHLVVVKGTEYFDGKTGRYMDFSITDVIQMIGRAGRPQYDDQGKAVVFVHDVKKQFYKHFLFEPFPVESNLLSVLSDHLNAEIVASTINTKQEAMDYLTWTYFFRRLVMNPSYYDLEDTDFNSINRYLSHIIERSLRELQVSHCLEFTEDGNGVLATTLGRIASYYYLTHHTLAMFNQNLTPENSTAELLHILSSAREYSELPVRHNEDAINSELARHLPLPVDANTYDSSNTKAHLLLLAHLSQQQLPSSDYLTDTKSVLDQAIRILQAMLDVVADKGWLVTAIRVINLIQMVIQGRWMHQSSLLALPHVDSSMLSLFTISHERGSDNKHNFSSHSYNSLIEEREERTPITTLPQLIHLCESRPKLLYQMLQTELRPAHIEEISHVLKKIPRILVNMSLKGWWAGFETEQTKQLPKLVPGVRRTCSDRVQVHADQEYTLSLNLRLTNAISRKRHQETNHAYAPRFPKPKSVGWFLLLGDVERREVVALKRAGGAAGSAVHRLAFCTPAETGARVYTLYVLSDCYLQLDQQYDVYLDVIEPDIGSQINSELPAAAQFD